MAAEVTLSGLPHMKRMIGCHLLCGICQTLSQQCKIIGANAAKSHGLAINTDRGAPENSAIDLKATQGIGVSARAGHIEGITKHDSDMLKE
ncbi:hypothetical protein GQ53DRAFT_815044 [Thozetella sp. PMI_491]|nr:hypothetical protein GQ53DRAFT_815044 [Thozetella sp. PMI_491]